MAREETLLTAADVRRLVRQEIERHGSGHKVARLWGVSPAFISYVLNGQRAPSATVLKALGLKRVIRYEALPSRPYFAKRG